jgi:hypothetical protein
MHFLKDVLLFDTNTGTGYRITGVTGVAGELRPVTPVNRRRGPGLQAPTDRPVSNSKYYYTRNSPQ